MLDSGLIPIIFMVAVAIVVLSIFFSFVPVMLWISALASGVRVHHHAGRDALAPCHSFAYRQPADQGAKSGAEHDTNQLESHYLAGGNVDRVVEPGSRRACRHPPALNAPLRSTSRP